MHQSAPTLKLINHDYLPLSLLIFMSSVASFNSEAFKNYRWESKFTFYSEDTDVLQGDNLFKLSETATTAELMKDKTFWLDVNNPSNQDLKTLAEVFSIHPLTMEEISTCSSHEKCEAFDDYIFMTVRTCNTDLFAESQYTVGGTSPPLGRPSSEPINLYILMFKQFTLSLHYQPMPIVTQVTRKIFQRRKQVKLTSDWYFYFLLDEVIDQFEPNLKKLEHEVDELDETTLFLKPADQTEMLRRIGRARNLVTHLSRLLKTKIETTKSITKRYNDRIQEQALLYLRDTHDKLLSLISSLDQNSETLTRAHSNYLAQISIEQAEMSNRMNLQVKHLTVITSLSLPFEIVGALWGMNVAVPFEIIDNRDVYLEELKPFFGLVLGCIVLSFVFWLVGRRLRFF